MVEAVAGPSDRDVEEREFQMLKKKWAAAVIVLLSWASMESQQVYAKSYLTDEIGEGSVFHLDSHLQSLAGRSQFYFQDGHTVAVTEIDPVKPYCVLKIKKTASDFIVHYANAASPHWFFNDKSEFQCRRVETEEDLNAAVQGLVSIEKHQDSRVEVSKN
jgi:hypothetical protein